MSNLRAHPPSTIASSRLLLKGTSKKIKQRMSLACSAHDGKFSSSHSSLMCDVIAQSLKSAPEKNGKINWQEVSALIQLRIADSDGQNSTIYSDIDCHRHWRYLAYGESHAYDDPNQRRNRKHEDSEEVQYLLLH